MLLAHASVVTAQPPNETLTIIVACIAASAVLIGAVLAALTAGSRQKRQLASETQRLDKSLTAETGRHSLTLAAQAAQQQRQLAHDRQLADVAELRALLDESTGALNRLERAVLAAITAAQQAHKLKTALDRMNPGEVDSERYRELLQAFEAEQRRIEVALPLVAEAAAHRDRIAIRLTAQHPVGTSFAEAVDALNKLLTHLPNDVSRPLTAAEQADVDQRRSAYDVARSRFVADAVQLVGTRIDAPATE